MVDTDERKAAMRAIQIARLDGPEAVELVDLDEPSGDGAVLVDVHAAGVTFPDALQSRGLYQYKAELPLPREQRSPGWCAARRPART